MSNQSQGLAAYFSDPFEGFGRTWKLPSLWQEAKLKCICGCRAIGIAADQLTLHEGSRDLVAASKNIRGVIIEAALATI